MIVAHPIAGLVFGKYFGYALFWLLGSVIPDIDHIFVMVKNKILSPLKIIDSIKNEEKYGVCYKTKYFHSIFGAVVVSALVVIIDVRGAAYFFLAYILHLVFDWPDKDKKQYLYPFSKKTFSGFLPIFSGPEVIFTALLTALYFL